MDLSKLEKLLAGEPAFRKKQVKQLVFCDLIDNWSEATTLSLGLRAKLEKYWPLEIEAGTFVAKDKRTAKALFILSDGLRVESVLMRHQERNTICVSSQVGCALGCSFCATGKLGFKRDLTAGEIVAQVLFWARWLKNGEFVARVASLPRGCHAPAVAGARNDIVNKINNIVFMGMGEPLLNYDNVLAAIKIINDPNGLAIGARHISISTVGIVEGIERLTQEPIQVNLAISLHAPTDELRFKLMPVNNKYPIKKVLSAVDKYIAKTRRKVMIEYIMIKGLNDSEKQARQLVKILKRPLVFVNLIAYNPTGTFTPLEILQKSHGVKKDNQKSLTGFKPSSVGQIKKFKDILMAAGIQALERYRFGEGIEAACGQLAGGENKKLHL